MAVEARAQIFSIPEESAPRYPVRGVVLNSLTRDPIPRVLVENSASAALTDGEGRFELALPEGMQQIMVRRPGYSTRGRNGNHTISAGANTPELTFYLTPEATIAGRVTLSTGEPADGITFMAYRKAVVEGRERWSMAASTATDNEGRFRMANLPAPGLWVVCSVPFEERDPHRFTGTLAPPAMVGYPPTCYPGPIPAPSDLSPANALALAPGQQAEIEIVLPRQPFFRVSIAIANAPASNGLDIQIHDPTGRILPFGAEWNAKRGTAEVYLPSGQYSAEAHNFGPAFASDGRVDFRVGAAPVAGLSMTMLPLHPIPVEIHKQFSPPAAQAGNGPEFRIRGSANPGLNLTLLPADSAMSESGGGGLGRQPGSNDGSLYQLENIVPGRYWVETYPFEGYIASIGSGGVDLTREPLTVGPGNSTAPIQIFLRNDGGQIQCAVTSPAGAATGEVEFYFIYAVPVAQTSSQIPQIQMQGPEPVTLNNLAPGTYRVVAYDQFQQIDLNNAQQLAEIASKGQTVTVTSGGTANVQLEPIHAANASEDDLTVAVE